MTTLAAAERTLERKEILDVGPDFELPEVLDVAPEVRTVGERDCLELTSAYYDTADLDLLRLGVTLRRRTGPVDRGWQLSFPDAGLRREIRLPDADSSAVPRELGELVVGVRRGKPLRRVVTLHIDRDVSRLCDDEGAVLATVSSDAVEATTLLGRTARKQWREIEVELAAAADEGLLDALDTRLIRAGAERTRTRSKLQHALGELGPVPEPAHDDTAGGIVAARLARHVGTLLIGDIAARLDDADVRRARRAVRRMHDLLRVYAILFDADRVSGLVGELAWLETRLEAVRDSAAVRARAAATAPTLPTALADPGLADRVDALLRERHEAARALLAKALRARRYLRLLDELADWTLAPPFTAEAGAAASALHEPARAARRVAADLLDAARVHDADDAALHRARLALARARTAAKLADPGRRRTRRDADVAAWLREHEDAAATAEALHRAAAADRTDAFALGVLFTLEKARAARARAAVQLG